MGKKSKIILSIFVILFVSVISYFIGYKKAYDYEKEFKLYYNTFYATITDIHDTGLTIDDTLLEVKGLEINDINFRGNFRFVITEATEIEWRNTNIETDDLNVGDNISIIFTGSIQETDPAKINDVLKIQLLDE